MSSEPKENYLNTIKSINENIGELKIVFTNFKRVRNYYILYSTKI